MACGSVNFLVTADEVSAALPLCHPEESCDFSIFSRFLQTYRIFFQPPNKTVILRACDFFDLFVFLHT
jgi:hypothetical protein